MTIYLLIIGLVILIPVAIGIAYVARNVSERRRREKLEGGEQRRNIEPVTLDRNPDMPHRTDATS